MNALVVMAQLVAVLPSSAGAGRPLAADRVVAEAPPPPAASYPFHPPVEIDLTILQPHAADVTFPFQPLSAEDPAQLGTTTLPGPSGPWGLRLGVSVRLPRGLGRIEIGTSDSAILGGDEWNRRFYALSVPILESGAPVGSASAYLNSYRSFTVSSSHLDWSHMLATHRGFSLTGRLSLRRAVIGQGASDTVHMLWPDGPGTVYFESECHKNMWGPRAGLDLRAPLAGGAALELSAGWTIYAVRLRDNDAYYSSENRSGRDESRTEGLPDFTASLWVPIGDHFGLRSGYYWENWGSGWTGDLRSSGLFFATTFVIGH